MLPVACFATDCFSPYFLTVIPSVFLRIYFFSVHHYQWNSWSYLMPLPPSFSSSRLTTSCCFCSKPSLNMLNNTVDTHCVHIWVLVSLAPSTFTVFSECWLYFWQYPREFLGNSIPAIMWLNTYLESSEMNSICYLHFHNCDKIPEISSLKEEKLAVSDLWPPTHVALGLCPDMALWWRLLVAYLLTSEKQRGKSQLTFELFLPFLAPSFIFFLLFVFKDSLHI